MYVFRHVSHMYIIMQSNNDMVLSVMTVMTVTIFIRAIINCVNTVASTPHCRYLHYTDTCITTAPSCMYHHQS